MLTTLYCIPKGDQMQKLLIFGDDPFWKEPSKPSHLVSYHSNPSGHFRTQVITSILIANCCPYISRWGHLSASTIKTISVHVQHSAMVSTTPCVSEPRLMTPNYATGSHILVEVCIASRHGELRKHSLLCSAGDTD